MLIVNKSLTIHGRVEFHAGQSENPTMGTIEDWYIINTMNFAHPIHIHLINFQIINVFDLKLFKSVVATCPYYQLDFIAQAVKNSTATDLQASVFFTNGSVNYTYLCVNLRQIVTDSRIIHSLSEIYPENYVKDKKSGLDLFTKDSNNTYKYIVGPGRPSSKVEYSQWKDTAFVTGFEVLQFRMRWSKSNYTAAVDDPIGSYFHAPADTMREYPGYVYHCHILDHEDNEMMRPIMLQLP
jgi:spore coat protein A, manganese oxidase